MHKCIFYIYVKTRIEISALDRLKKKKVCELKKKASQKHHEIISGSPCTVVSV